MMCDSFVMWCAMTTQPDCLSFEAYMLVLFILLMRFALPVLLGMHSTVCWSVVVLLKLLCLLCCSAFDLEDKVVGTVGCGRIGQRVLQRLAVSPCLNYSCMHARLALPCTVQHFSKVGWKSTPGVHACQVPLGSMQELE